MAIPRSQQINVESTPYYHIMTRCVRRTFLCGKDKETGRDYSHRKAWLVTRMKTLADIFAINICAYAVMSNHYHLVLHIDESEGLSWSVDELKARWSALFPRDAKKLESMEKNGTPQQVIVDKIDSWRERLMSISWFMRCLNEPIARQSNLEDEMTGRFWEGRFKSQSLLDEAALLSAMVYVDLNPVRANINETPETSEFTSIYDRIQAVSNHKTKASRLGTPASDFAALCDANKVSQPFHLMPIKRMDPNNLADKSATIDLKLSDYIALVDETGRAIREDKKGHISHELQPILDRLQVNTSGWFKLATSIEEGFFYAVGSLKELNAFNKDNRERRIRGAVAASSCYSVDS